MKIAQCVDLFVERKRVCGYDYDAAARILRRFASSLGEIDISLITEEHINAFLSSGQISHNVWRSYRSLIRRFLAYWFAWRKISRIPEPEQKPVVPTRFFPYVYSKAEIARLVESAHTCQVRKKCGMGPITLRTIILFLYGTGLRVKEALSLTVSNIHFHDGLIEIHPDLLYRHRIIPIGTDVRRLLRRYLRSPEHTSVETGKALFLTTTGRPVPYSMLMQTFQRLRKVAGVFRPNSPLPPRLQDLRHSFAVHSITRWADEGWSYEKMLPMLASYMGNVRDKGFLRYFELTPSCFRPQLDCLDVPSSIPNRPRRLESGRRRRQTSE